MRNAMEQYPLHLNRILKTWGGVSGRERIKINFSSSACRRVPAMDVNFMRNQLVKKQLVRVIIFIFVYALICSDLRETRAFVFYSIGIYIYIKKKSIKFLKFKLRIKKSKYDQKNFFIHY